MNPTKQELERIFARFSDEELLARYESGALTEEAMQVALNEVHSRGLSPAEPRPAAEEGDGEAYYGDFVIVVRDLNMVEAHTYRLLLQAAGVPTEVGDENFSRIYGSMYSANVKVPEAFVTEAVAIFEAYKRGDFALDADFELDEDPGSGDAAP